MFHTPYRMYSSHDEQKIAVRFWGQFKLSFSIFVNEVSKCYFNFCVFRVGIVLRTKCCDIDKERSQISSEELVL
jgi:hypothetical protein